MLEIVIAYLYTIVQGKEMYTSICPCFTGASEATKDKLVREAFLLVQDQLQSALCTRQGWLVYATQKSALYPAEVYAIGSCLILKW